MLHIGVASARHRRPVPVASACSVAQGFAADTCGAQPSGSHRGTRSVVAANTPGAPPCLSIQPPSAPVVFAATTLLVALWLPRCWAQQVSAAKP